MQPYGNIDWIKVTDMLGAIVCHPFGQKGVVIYSFGFRACKGINGCQTLILTDNGGEIKIAGLNAKISLPSIPITYGVGYCGPMTIASRLWHKFNERDIDYDEILD